MFTLFTLNPYASLIFFIPVILFSMVFMNPVYVCINTAASFACCMILAKKETLASIRYTLSFALVIMLINPLFSTGGKTVLFTYFGRPYTLEALVYGGVMAGIMTSCINWFSCMGKVLTKDKFIYITGGRMPVLSSLLSMVTGLVPFFQAKLSEISQVQSALSKRSPAENALRSLNSATAYAFEHAVNLSVSMRNRGFGTGKKTQYAKYRIHLYDVIFITVTLLLTAITAGCCFTPATTAQIVPELIINRITATESAGIICYVLLLMTPVITALFEEIEWLYLKSKI